MRHGLKGWWRAALGGACVLLLAAVTGTILTALKQHRDEERITRVERVVEAMGIGVGKPVERRPFEGAPALGGSTGRGRGQFPETSLGGGPVATSEHGGSTEAVKPVGQGGGAAPAPREPGPPPSPPEETVAPPETPVPPRSLPELLKPPDVLLESASPKALESVSGTVEGAAAAPCLLVPAC